jgi:hypothetical protein
LIATALAGALVIGLAVFVRSFHVQSSDFPLGDGGLFLQMTQALRANGYAIPEEVLYNGLGIPFAYPPLGFYVAGLLTDAVGLSELDAMRWLPLAVSCGTVVVAWAFANSVLSRGIAVLAATFAFATLPLAYRYFIMGAGITRSLGLLFAVIAIWMAFLLCTRRRQILAVPLALAAGLTLLSHPNAAWFGAYSTGLVFLFYCRDRRTLISGLLAAGGALAVAAPWLAVAISRHGPLIFLDAAQSSNPGISAVALLLTLQITQEPLFPILGLTALAGAVVLARRGQWWLPVWLVAACVLDTRYQGTFAMVPVALLVGAAVGALGERLGTEWTGSTARLGLRAAVLAGAAVLAILAVVGTLRPGFALRALPESTLEAMRWVADSTLPDAEFLVIAPTGVSAGSESEWFPVIAERRSLGTYQGLEWLPLAPGPTPWERFNSLQACGGRDVACLDEWADETGSDFEVVFVREAGTENLRNALADSPDFALVHQTPDVWIYARFPR